MNLPFCVLCEGAVIFCFQLARRGANVDFKHAFASFETGKRDVYPLFKATLDGGVELPRNIGCPEHEDTGVIVPHAIHLN